MSGLTRDNLQQHCRTCLAKMTKTCKDGKYQSWHHVRMENYLADWIYNFTSINVREESYEYPTLVCNTCYEIFKDLDSFQQLVWRTEKTLAAFLGRNCENDEMPKKQQKKRKVLNNPVANCKDKDKINSNEAMVCEPEPMEHENICKIKSNFNEPNMEHSPHVANDNEEMLIKTEISDDHLNEDDNNCNNLHNTESNCNEFLHSGLNEPKLEQSPPVSESKSTVAEEESLKLNESECSTQPKNKNIDEMTIKTETSKVNVDDDNINSIAENELSEVNESNLECSMQDQDLINQVDEVDVKTESPNDDFNEENNKSNIAAEDGSSSNNIFQIEMLDADSVTDFDIKLITDLELSNDDTTVDLTEYTCEKCNLHYDNKYNCLAHKRLTHGPKRKRGYKCAICPKSYLAFYNMDRHMREIHNIFVRPYKCEYTKCGCRFRDWSARITHYHEYHQQIKAGRITSSWDNLKYEKNLFICIVCNKQYPSLNYIKFHMPTHGDDLKYFCGICGARHFSQMKLNCHYDKTHDSKYTNIKRCKICLKLFYNKDQIEEHILLEHKRIFACQYCTRRFRTKYGLMFHQPVHNTKSFSCGKCGTSYPTFDVFRNHMQVVHCEFTVTQQLSNEEGRKELQK